MEAGPFNEVKYAGQEASNLKIAQEIYKRESELKELKARIKRNSNIKPLPEVIIDPEWLKTKLLDLENILNQHILQARNQIKKFTSDIVLTPITENGTKIYRASGMGKLGNILGIYDKSYILLNSGGRI
jgi:hypothetical protein